MQYCLHCRGDELTSDAVDANSRPYLTLKKKAGSCEVSVGSFEYLEQLLKCAGSRKIAETRKCLEGVDIY